MHDATLRVTRATRAATANGRRSALIGASAAVVCLGGVLTGCGSGGGHGGYAAVGAAGASGPAHGEGGPTAGVTFVPLDGGGRTGGGGRTEGAGGRDGGSPSATATDAHPGTGTAAPGPAGTGGAAHPGTGATPPTSAPGASHSPTTAPAPPAGTAPPAPAALTWSGPELADGAHRWCDEVTVGFRNSGGSPVRSGTVTFGTHIIDALGIDWATRPSAQDLPVPIGAGARLSRTWTVCVESWRVPLGMHVETRDVSVRWD